MLNVHTIYLSYFGTFKMLGMQYETFPFEPDIRVWSILYYIDCMI